MRYDVFISHSSIDKETIARPLATALEKHGLSTWLDEEQLNVGDSIRRGIDEALRCSRFGIVILSQTYLKNEWTLKELDALFNKEKKYSKTVLPISHGLELSDIEFFSPLLADKVFLNTKDRSIDNLAKTIQDSIRVQDKASSPPSNRSPQKKWISYIFGNNIQWLILGSTTIATIIILTWLISKNMPIHIKTQPAPMERDNRIYSQGDLKIEATEGGTVIISPGDSQIFYKD